jgi:hypothetical protein
MPSRTSAAPGTDPLPSGLMARTQLSTFKFSKPPSTMSEEELGEMADKILDQWSEDLKDDDPTPTK